MRRILVILVILLILFLPSLGYSDQYVLVMSKDDSVCQHMLKVYNQDLKNYGDILYGQHEEFNISWERKEYIFKFKDFSYSGHLMISKFDINNDGKREIILKIGDKGLKGIPSDQLFIFDEKDIDISREELVLTEGLAEKAVGIWGGAFAYSGKPFAGHVYNLQELPSSLGGWFFFHPFLYKGVYFTSMNDRVPNNESKWEVILQYSSENLLKDVCYFRKE